MKVLHISQYISIANDPEFSRNISGYGYMVLDIAKAESEVYPVNQIDLITHGCITKGRKIGKLKLLPRRWFDIIRFIKFRYLIQSIIMILKIKCSLFWMIRIIFYYLGMGHIQHIIERGNYDIIHLHGIAYSMVPLIEFCKINKKKFLTTLHGLISFDESVGVTSQEILLERDFLKQVLRDNLVLTVISFGIKKRIIDYLAIKKADNIFVVLNGTAFANLERTGNHINIRQHYSIPLTVKVVLCVGNISRRKNQASILKALKTIDISLLEQFKILFLGSDSTGVFERSICQLNLTGRAIFCGNIPKDYIGEFYRQADYTILASKNEGFGLSIIEGFLYGLPCITFADLDAIEDIYDPKVMYLVNERTDKALATGIANCLFREWDRDFIKQYASRFNIESTANAYLSLYDKIIEDSLLYDYP